MLMQQFTKVYILSLLFYHLIYYNIFSFD